MIRKAVGTCSRLRPPSSPRRWARFLDPLGLLYMLCVSVIVESLRHRDDAYAGVIDELDRPQAVPAMGVSVDPLLAQVQGMYGPKRPVRQGEAVDVPRRISAGDGAL